MRLFFLVAFLISLSSIAQEVKPYNGAKPSEAKIIAFTNARIVVSSEKTIENGTLVVEGNRIKSVGGLLSSIPKNAVVIDLDGKTIMPTFIESYSNIGLPQVKRKPWTPSPQIETSKNGAYYWNEAIHPEINAAESYSTDTKSSENYQKMGFGIAVTHIQDGIMRGQGAAVALGNLRAGESMISPQAAAFYSFQKGVSRQSYPSSQMGSIALFRQTLYDAKYYISNPKSERNLSLEALNAQLNGKMVFKVEDKLELLRVKKIADEFGIDFTMIGSGNEYERISEFKEWKSPLIIPIDFPKAYEVKDPFVSRQIPLSDLKHWELAPSNPYFLHSNGVDFAITSEGCKNEKEFWTNLRKAISRGLSKEQTLKALTETPAIIFGLQDDLGTLEEGKLASFNIFNRDPFVYNDASVLEQYSVGKKHTFTKEPAFDVRGEYKINIQGLLYDIKIAGEKDKLNGNATYIRSIRDSIDGTFKRDTLKSKAFVSLNDNDVVIQFNSTEPNNYGAITLHGVFNEKIGVLEGQGQIQNGNWVKWTGIRKGTKKKDDKELKKIELDSVSLASVWYPNMSFGFDTLPEAQVYVLRNATVWTNEEDGIISDATVILKNGKISFVGTGNYQIPPNAIEIDAKGKHITSGIIDEHSHISISKGVNEGGQAISAEVSIADVVRSDDINVFRQLSGGVTTSQLLHGSANPIGGQSALIKLKWGYTPEQMLIENSPKFIKFALGENVKQSNWGSFNTVRFPQTRMGVEQVFYDAFIRAKEYHEAWETYNGLSEKRREKNDIKAPAKDLELEAIWEIVNSERFISCHSYVQSEINMLMHVADSMGFTVNTFTHILEGYKVADKMAAHGAGGSTFADWWAYKYEVKDAIPYNASLMHEQGVLVAINSDDAEMGRRLNQEAGKVVKYGGVSQEDAWKMVTLNPAKLLHLDEQMGSVKVDKDADIVIWSDNPLSVNAICEKTFIDGELLYDRSKSKELAELNNQERARIISLMLGAKEEGAETQEFEKKEEKHYHCDTIEEE